jgi:hypothetical protein
MKQNDRYCGTFYGPKLSNIRNYFEFSITTINQGYIVIPVSASAVEALMSRETIKKNEIS